jgi:hypothetical protein
MRISAKSKKPQFWSVQETLVSLARKRVAGEARKWRIVRALEHRFHVFAPIFAPDRNSSIAFFMWRLP